MEKAFVEALKKGWENISHLSKEGKIEITYFGEKIEVDLNSKNFYPEIEPMEKILILHYLSKKTSNEKNDEFISFKDLKEGTFYYPSIYSRIYSPIIEKFGKSPELFVEKGIKAGGIKISDFTLKFTIFPDVYFILELIPEDEEFLASLKILFNKKSSEIFEIEDLTIIGEIIVSKLLKQ